MTAFSSNLRGGAGRPLRRGADAASPPQPVPRCTKLQGVVRASRVTSPTVVAAAAASQRPTDSAERHHHDVAIIGGGPAGLATAKALQAVMGPGADVKVYEAVPVFQRSLGAGVSVEVSGWRALHAVDRQMAERMRSRAILLSASRYFDEAGAPLLSYQRPPIDHEGNVRLYGHTPAVLHWGDIRQVLYEALPPGTVQFGSRLVGLTPGQLGGEPAVVELQVPDGAPQDNPQGPGASGGPRSGTGSGPSSGGRLRRVTADLVIAADGYYSRTKRLAFGASGPPLLPAYRGKVIWRALVGYRDPDQMPALLRELGGKREAVTWMPEGVPLTRTSTVYPVNDNRFVWTFIAPADDIEAAGLPPWSPQAPADSPQLTDTERVGTNPLQRCMAVFRHHPSEVLDVLARTDPRGVTERGYYTHDMEAIRGSPDWVRGNVVAVGDAAHTGPPDGMGLNMALEDAAVLAAQAVEAYCAARLPRVRDVWCEVGLQRPRREAAKLAAAFEPLGPGSSGPERTGPVQVATM